MMSGRGRWLRRLIHTAAPLLAGALPVAASAEPVEAPYYRERQALSLFLGPGASYTEYIKSSDNDLESGGDGSLDLGGTRTLGYDGDELFLLIRGSARGLDLSFAAGYRTFFGVDAWQTFFDAGALVRPFSGPWVGPRVGFGVRHTFSERLAVFGGLGITLGFGSGLRGDAEVFTGVQWIFPVGSQ